VISLTQLLSSEVLKALLFQSATTIVNSMHKHKCITNNIAANTPSNYNIVQSIVFFVHAQLSQEFGDLQVWVLLEQLPSYPCQPKIRLSHSFSTAHQQWINTVLCSLTLASSSNTIHIRPGLIIYEARTSISFH